MHPTRFPIWLTILLLFAHGVLVGCDNAATKSRDGIVDLGSTPVGVQENPEDAALEDERPFLTSTPDVDNVHLTTPTPEELFQLLTLNKQQALHLREQNDNPDERLLTMAHARDAAEILVRELKSHYPDGIPHPEIILDYPAFQFDSNFELFVLIDFYTDAAFQILREQNIPLESEFVLQHANFEATVTPIEINRNRGPVGLVALNWEPFLPAHSWLLLEETEAGEVQRLKHELPVNPLPQAWTDQLLYLGDINGDGLTDVIHQRSTMMAGSVRDDFTILAGDSEGLSEISEFRVSSFYFHGLHANELRKVNDHISLVITEPHKLSWGCVWNSTSIYSWHTHIETRQVLNDMPPDSAACHLAQGISQPTPSDPQMNIEHLKTAVAYLEEAGADQNSILAFAHFRLALLYAIEAEHINARFHLAEFTARLPTTLRRIEPQLDVILEQASIDAVALCTLLQEAALETPPPAWEEHLYGSGYPYYPDLQPSLVCRLQEISSSTSELAEDNHQPERLDHEEKDRLLIQDIYRANGLPELVVELETARSEIRGEQSESQLEWQRLTFLIGKCYELLHDESQALDEYLSISETEPQSIWYLLALLHLEME